MKALEQSYRTGTLRLVDVLEPRAGHGRVLVRTAASLASVGTEKGMMELARKSLLGKALARPDLVRQVLDKARTEGLLEAWRQAMGRLDTPVLLGYSSAGAVIDAGPGVSGFKAGDRVACAGAGYAGHVEVASVPANLCVRIPDGVSFEEASFVAIGGIALEAVRMGRVGLGDRVAVIGLGLLGQVAVQLLKAAGCHVFGVDVSPQKAAVAEQHGAEMTCAASDGTAVQSVLQWSGGDGADAVIILAATNSNGPLEQAAAMCRERGRVVATGLVGLEVPRREFYEKELDLVVSRAWGPGVYDKDFSEKGLKYPLAYARWSAERNMAEFLSQLQKGTVRVDHLITHRFPIDRAVEAYEMVLEGTEPYIGVVLTYDEQKDSDVSRTPDRPASTAWVNRRPSGATQQGVVRAGVIGAGLFASGTLIPAMRRVKGLALRGLATSSGFSGHHSARKHGFGYCTTDYRQLLDDPEIDLVFILTRHGSHGRLASEALSAGKHAFVEKPLALDVDQLRQVVESHQQASQAAVSHGSRPPVLMVGFNRRFSPFTIWLKERFGVVREPLSVSVVVNAGDLPADSWVRDPEDGGGRIVGEVCHFVDLVSYLTSSSPAQVYAERIAASGDSDSVVATLRMSDGSIASITYAARGDKRYPRERVEVFGGGAVGVIENFKKAAFYLNGRTQRLHHRLSVDRGHQAELEVLLAAVQGRSEAPVSITDYALTTLTTLAMERSLRSGRPEPVEPVV